MLLSLSFTITSPFCIYSSRFSSAIKFSLLILNDSVFFETADPKLSIFSEKSFLTTSVTIIPGGGLFPNFFAKCCPIKILPTITIVIY